MSKEEMEIIRERIEKVPVLESKINLILSLAAGQFIAVLVLIVTIFNFLIDKVN